MDFSGAPVLVEFFFGLAFLAGGLLIRLLPRFPFTIQVICCACLLLLAWWMSAPYSLVISAMLLLGSCLASPGLRLPLSRSWAWCLRRADGTWMAPALALSGGVFLIVAPAHILEAIEARKALELEKILDSVPELDMSAEVAGFTDKGGRIGLYSGAAAREHDDLAWLHAHDYDFQLVRLDVDEGDCNCHGHVFAGGRYWVLGRDIPAILNDNGYRETDVPAPGDLVIHRNSEGVVIHTGIVRACGPGFPVLVESKWGQLGVYIHPVDRTPYAGPRNYYRATRGSHIIRIEERRTG